MDPAAGSPTVVVIDVGALEHVDLGTVDALARLQLFARRRGYTIHLRHAPDDLQRLLALTGLASEFGGQVEEREETLGLEEEVEPGDPAT